MIGAVAVGAAAYVAQIVYERKRKTQNTTDLMVGDVIIERGDTKNPFTDLTYKYETVKEIRKNDNGETWFISYTSDRDGNPTPNQNEFRVEHRGGRHFWPEDWDIVNHIDL